MSEHIGQGREAVYCNSCNHFPLANCKDDPQERATCAVREVRYAWDSRACMFYERAEGVALENRKAMVIYLFKRREGKADAATHETAEAGK
jgi:hypothetical protein